MDFLRPYPAHLQRGTLLLICRRDISQRLFDMERVIHIESLLTVVAGLVTQIAGFFVLNGILLAVGGVLLTVGVTSWIVRLWLLRQRSTTLPSMLFISNEGIDAIVQYGESITMSWKEMQARPIVFVRRYAPTFSLRSSDRRITGLTLRAPGCPSLHVTNDLEGYDELLEILEEMDIPVLTLSSRLFSIRNVRTDWRRRLEQRAHRWKN